MSKNDKTDSKMMPKSSQNNIKRIQKSSQIGWKIHENGVPGSSWEGLVAILAQNRKKSSKNHSFLMILAHNLDPNSHQNRPGATKSRFLERVFDVCFATSIFIWFWCLSWYHRTSKTLVFHCRVVQNQWLQRLYGLHRSHCNDCMHCRACKTSYRLHGLHRLHRLWRLHGLCRLQRLQWF